MAVYKRGAIYHYDFTVGADRFRGSTGLRSKTAALAYAEREKERASLGRSYRAVSTLEAVANKWFTARVRGKASAKSTARRLETVMRLMGPETLITDIDMPEIEEAVQARRLEAKQSGVKKGELIAVSNASVNRDMIDHTLRPMFNYARRVLKIPVADIEWRRIRLQEPKGKTRTFTAAEITAWRDALPAHHRPLMDFLLRYGVRLKEAFFSLEDFDPAGRVVLRSRKAGDDHPLPLLPEDARDIAARVGRAKAAGLDVVWFRETRDGLKASTWRGFESASKKALVKAGIGNARPAHDFRHHAATVTLRASGNLKTVQRLLGHASITSTARYAHANETDVLEALRHASATTPDVTEKKPKQNRSLRRKGNRF